MSTKTNAAAGASFHRCIHGMDDTMQAGIGATACIVLILAIVLLVTHTLLVSITDARLRTFWDRVQPCEYGFLANVNSDAPHARWSQSTERVLGIVAAFRHGSSTAMANSCTPLRRDIWGAAVNMRTTAPIREIKWFANSAKHFVLQTNK
jgi:hypothetical protein